MKTICVPVNASAQQRLDYDECLEDDLISMDMDNETCYQLFELGVFNKINKMAGCIIDDFEDDRITDTGKLKTILNSGLFNENIYSPEINNLITKIKNLFDEALKRNTGVYFYF